MSLNMMPSQKKRTASLASETSSIWERVTREWMGVMGTSPDLLDLLVQQAPLFQKIGIKSQGFETWLRSGIYLIGLRFQFPFGGTLTFFQERDLTEQGEVTYSWHEVSEEIFQSYQLSTTKQTRSSLQLLNSTKRHL